MILIARLGKRGSSCYGGISLEKIVHHASGGSMRHNPSGMHLIF